MRHPRRLARAVAGVSVLGLAALSSMAMGASGNSSRAHHYSAWDKHWLQASIQGDRFEIAGGRTAETKGTRAAVRDLGKRLVDDHTKSLKEATALAHELGITVPVKPTQSQQFELRVVGAKSGSDFDHWYSDLEVSDHIQDITEAKDEVSDGSNAAIRHDAKKEIPTLREHLALARAALAQSG